jgi:hypothetical protein
MKTKTLLMAAATLAAGVIASQAAVYSLNTVGYYNTIIPAHGYVILGNQLINGSDASQTNNDIQTALSSGFVSDPNGPPNGINSAYFSWTGSGYNTVYYFNALDATNYGMNSYTPSGAGWYTQGGDPAVINLNQGYSAFVYNPSSLIITNTISGVVNQGTNLTIIPTGYSLLSILEPVAGVDPGTNTSMGLPPTLSSDPNGPPNGVNDEYFQWTGSGYNNFYYFNANDATNYGMNSYTITGSGFYTQGGDPMPSAAYAQVGQGFFLLHHGSGVTWTNAFTIP